MTVYNYTVKQKIDGKRVVALGFFDGVHLGHRALLQRAKEEARERGALLAVFTFAAETFGKKGVGRLYSTEEKLEIFEELGVDEVIIADFGTVANIAAEDFVVGTLIGDIGAVCTVCGEDFRFGQGARGDLSLLERLMRESGGDCISVTDECLGGVKVSTTKIKELLADGDVAGANALLGAPLYLSGVVEKGLGLGKKLGFPTVNTPIGAKGEILRRGVYRSRLSVDGKDYDAITNVGICPTFEEREVHQETFVLCEIGDLYGKKIKVFLLEFLRDEKRFDSKNDLIMQINVDINRIKGAQNEFLNNESEK